MYRYRLDALEAQAGLLYFQGKPFAGIAYEVQGNRVVANHLVTNGVGNGAAEIWDSTRPRVVCRALKFVEPEDTNEQFPKEGDYLDGVFFEGVAYTFDQDTGQLLKEQDFRPDPPAPSREWYKSGSIKADLDRLRSDGTWESETYYENGHTSGVQSEKLGWDLTPGGRLRTLRVATGVTESDIERVIFRVDSRLYLAGQGVTDEIVERLEDISRLEYLHLDSTGISAKGLDRIRVCTNLKELVTRSNNGVGEVEIRELVARLPGCKWDCR